MSYVTHMNASFDKNGWVMSHTQTNHAQHRLIMHIPQHTATHCNILQHTATYCTTLQHTAIHCNTHRLIMHNSEKLIGRAAPNERPSQTHIVNFVLATGGGKGVGL